MGGSYGGYMVLAGLAFQPELWAAGVDIVGISSFVTFLENTAPWRRKFREREYGSLEEDYDFLVEASPITHIDRMRAPLFIIHGTNDPRVPLIEAQQIHAALKEKGVTTELLVYDDEGHGLGKLKNRLDAYPKAADFLDRVLRTGMTDTLVVVNPRAGRGSAAKIVMKALADAGLDADVVATERPGHGIELARKARADGVRLVIAAGGDGTVHEVVNGLLADGTTGVVPELGVLPLGSGCDYAKTFDIPHDPGAALGAIVTSSGRAVDVAELTYTDERRTRTRLFANIAEVGIGGSCVARAARLPRFLGPAMYGVAFMLTLPRFKQLTAKITLDDQTYDGPLTDLVVAIGKVFGGGMRVAPIADPSDGLFDVQIHWGTKVDYVRGLPKVYKGTHIPHPRIREERAAMIAIDCDPVGLIEADGEVLGTTPARFAILPSAIRLRA